MACARAFAAEPVSVWYRSSEGCPEASAFLAKVNERAAEARLAQVGDHIDFVVTLGATADGASGRLERQTSRGTVAIRELRGARCETVAEGLALTLALTVDADSPGEEVTDGRESPESEPRATQPDTSPKEASASPANTANSQGLRVASASGWGDENESFDQFSESPASAGRHGSSHPWKVGAGPSGTTLIDGRALLGVGLFLELQSSAMPALKRRSLRLTARGGLLPHAASNVRVAIVSGRIDASPVAFGSATLQVRPALALDLGVLSAENRVTFNEDRALWASVTGLLRLCWQPRERFGLEGEVGLAVPLTRYELWGRVGQAELARVDAVGATAGLAATFSLP